MENSIKLKKHLLKRLRQAGLERSLIPGFLRSVANSVFIVPHFNLTKVNEHLRYLGWDNFKLDYHTLELAIAYFEAEGLHSVENIQGFLFDNFILASSSGIDKGQALAQ